MDACDLHQCELATTNAAAVIAVCVSEMAISSIPRVTANSAAAPYGLRIGLLWFIPGIMLAAGYFVYTYRNFAGKVGSGE